MKFILNGYEDNFIAEAPEDITLKQLLKQCDKIIPDSGPCGICSFEYFGHTEDAFDAEIIIDYESIKKVKDYVCCRIKEK